MQTRCTSPSEKGFDGLKEYGGGAQWQDWRFTTVGWLSQERPEFETLLKTIERMKEEPEEPTNGSAMTLDGGAAHGRPAVVL